MNCTLCGADNTTDAKFCRSCGMVLPEAEASSADATTTDAAVADETLPVGAVVSSDAAASTEPAGEPEAAPGVAAGVLDDAPADEPVVVDTVPDDPPLAAPVVADETDLDTAAPAEPTIDDSAAPPVDLFAPPAVPDDDAALDAPVGDDTVVEPVPAAAAVAADESVADALADSWAYPSVAGDDPSTDVRSRRIIAMVIDLLAVGGLSLGLLTYLAGSYGTLSSTGDNPLGFDLGLHGTNQLKAIGLVTAVVLVYFVLLEALVGATLGKLITGLRVRSGRDAGGSPGLLRSLLRGVFLVVDLTGVGLLLMMFTRRHQRLGDLMANTVVTAAPRPSGRPIALASAVVLATAGIGYAYTTGSGAAPLDQQFRGREVGSGSSSGNDNGRVKGRYTSIIITNDPNGTESLAVMPNRADIVYVLFNLEGAPSGSQAGVQFWAQNVEGENPEVLIDATAGTVTGNTDGAFTLRRTAEVWPAGTYRVDLFLGDVQVASKTYRVEKSDPAPTTTTTAKKR